MLPDEKVKCPATGFKRSCRSIVTAPDCVCPKFVNVKGMDPQSGQVVDHWGCVDGFLPLLLIENSQQSRQAGAAVESLRNEIVRVEESKRDALLQLARNGARLGLAGN